MSESTLESAQYQLKKRTQEKIADLARKYDVRTEEHVPVQTVSNWIEAIGPGDLVSTADRYTWTIPKSKFQSKSPSQNDTIYFFVKPDLTCKGPYKIISQPTENGTDLVIEVVLETEFSQPVSLKSLYLHSETSNEIKAFYQSLIEDQSRTQLEQG